MTELVGRFLGFEEHLGRDLVKFVYYVLLFLLVVTTLYELVVALIGLFDRFWLHLGRFLVLIPLRFFVALLLLRVGTELIMAILSIDDQLQTGADQNDSVSSGLNTPSRAAGAMATPAPVRKEAAVTPAALAASHEEKADGPEVSDAGTAAKNADDDADGAGATKD